MGHTLCITSTVQSYVVHHRPVLCTTNLHCAPFVGELGIPPILPVPAILDRAPSQLTSLLHTIAKGLNGASLLGYFHYDS